MINEADAAQSASTSGVAPVQFSAPAEATEFDANASAAALDAAKRSPFDSDTLAAAASE